MFRVITDIEKWAFPSNYMQTPPPLKRPVFIFFVQNVAQCSKTNEKSIIRFIGILVFEMWSFKNGKIVTNWLKKDAQCSQTDF